jgi:hypothetical protein
MDNKFFDNVVFLREIEINDYVIDLIDGEVYKTSHYVDDFVFLPEKGGPYSFNDLREKKHRFGSSDKEVYFCERFAKIDERCFPFILSKRTTEKITNNQREIEKLERIKSIIEE